MEEDPVEEFRPQRGEAEVLGLGCNVQGLGFRIQGLWLRI